MMVPISEVATAEPMRTDDEREGLSPQTLLALWGFAGVFVLGCVLFLIWYSRASHQAEIADANDRISQAVVAAKQWIDGDTSQNGESVERRLVDVLNDQIATERDEGESVLIEVRRHQSQVARERLQRQATAIWNEAKQQIKVKRVANAIPLLKKYVADPYAIDKSKAEQLLVEAETAVSDSLALECLLGLSEEEFDTAMTSGEIEDGKVKDPVLVAVRKETILRNLEASVQTRAERKRQEDTRKIAVEQTRMAEDRRRNLEMKTKLANLRNPETVSFKDLTNFPEDYLGKHVRINSVWFHGDLERERKIGVFTVGVSSRDGKRVSNVLLRGELKFVVSEDFGRTLDLLFEADKMVGTNLCCEIAQMGEYLVGRVYRIETLNLNGDVLNAYDDKRIIGGG
ncbi:hypothetical protein DSM3645_04660, partial [Blastopirellula marina DSM 3645]